MSIRTIKRSASRHFRLIDPLSPPSPKSGFGSLSGFVIEAATWFFSKPTENSRGAIGVERGARSLEQIEESIDVALLTVAKHGASKLKTVSGTEAAPTSGACLVDFFCDRYIKKQKAWRHTLSDGAVIGQRELLCAAALYKGEEAARAIKAADAVAVCRAMGDLLELICEIRRVLDREAGATVAARRARLRHEKTYRMRGKAHALYEAGKWPSVRKASQAIHDEVAEYARSIGTGLSPDRSQQTVYEWLLAYKRYTTAQQP